jgi:hypothetical protein
VSIGWCPGAASGAPSDSVCRPNSSWAPMPLAHTQTKKEETRTKVFPPLFAPFGLIYADCLYEMGIVNTPLTEGLNFH